MSLYTDDVKKLIYRVKSRLPADFPLTTEDMDYYIIVYCPMEKFAWRTVEDRLTIALELTELCKLIKETGIECVIEKN